MSPGQPSDRPDRLRPTGPVPFGIFVLLAGFFLYTIPRAAGAETGNLGATLKQLGYEQVILRGTAENHLFLFGRVNGRPRSCLVDTGWSYTTINLNTARRLTTPGTVNELQLGRVTLTNEPVVAQALRVNGQPASFDLVLGCDFLIRHHAVIDCAGRRLYLRHEPLANEARKTLAEVLHRRGGGGGAARLTRREPLALTCAAKLNGGDVELLVDTGAMWSCLDSRTTRALGLRVAASPNQITGAAAAGKREFGVTRITAFELGGRKTANVNFAVLDLADWGLGPDGQILSSVGGILGGDELAASRAVIDCDQLQLWRRSPE